MEATLLVLSAYLLGGIPAAYLVARLARGIDLRRHGSGNLGASNVSLYVGRRAGLGVGFADLSKGAVPVLAARWLGMGPDVQGLAVIAAVAGHTWSPYMRLQGGRGITTAAGGVGALGLPILAATFAAMAIVGYLRRDSALWIGMGIALLPIVGLAMQYPQDIVLSTAGLALVVVTKRLLANGFPEPARGVSRWEALRYRLLYDRDVRERDGWVHRLRSPEDPGS